MAEDAVRVCHNGEQLGAELLTGNDRIGYGGEVEEGRMGCGGRGNDGVGGDLVEDFWTWNWLGLVKSRGKVAAKRTFVNIELAEEDGFDHDE